MANSSAKKRTARNTEILQFFLYGILAVNAVYVLVRLIWMRESTHWWLAAGAAATTVLYVLAYGQLSREADAGFDLGAEGGLKEYYKDVIYISWVVQLVSIFWAHIWWLYSVVPVFAVYKLYTSVIAPMRAASAEQPETEEDKARRERADERSERRRMKKSRF